MEKINFITRCSRQNNLLEISKGIFNTNLFDINWYIIFDIEKVSEVKMETLVELSNLNVKISYEKSESGDHGHQMINKCIDSIEDGWIYVLDDDNIIHEDFFNEIYKIIKENPDKSGLIFSQKIGGIDFTGEDIRYASPDNVKVSRIDMAQFLLKRDLIADERIPNGYYVGDGMFIESLFNKNKEDFFFIDKVLCYYNYFQQVKKPNRRFLPRILMIGDESDLVLETLSSASFESKELNVLKKVDDSDLDSTIKDFDPDAILTIGKDFNDFEKLNNKHFDIRKRWIHFGGLQPDLGDISYFCGSNYILNPHYKENPLVSLFTPIYNTGEKLWRAYESIRNQTYSNWEWVMVNDSNDEGVTLKIAETISRMDCRVKVYDFHKKTGGIVGESKYRAACLCDGIYLMEFDHDDYLLPDALQLMVEAFQKYPDCKFVYSDFAEIDENHNSLTYGDSFSFDYGSYRDEVWNGRTYKTVNTSGINPKTIRHIVGVPNHFRAWERFFYHSIGGHNRRLSIADDYELIVRTFLHTKMVRIPKLLYLQFYHNSNTQNATRSDIQRRVKSISAFYNERIKQRFKELGFEDWAYNFNPQFPLLAPSLFGDDECAVNYIMGKKNNEYSYDWNSINSN